MFEVKVLAGEGVAQEKSGTQESKALQVNQLVPFDADVINRGELPLALAIFKDGVAAGEVVIAPSGKVRFENMVNTADNSAAMRLVPFCDDLVEVSSLNESIFVGAEESCSGAETGLFGIFAPTNALGASGTQVASAGVIVGGFFISENSADEQPSPDGTSLPSSFMGNGSTRSGVSGSSEALSAGLENSTLAPLAPLGAAVETVADGLVNLLAGLTDVLPGITQFDLSSIGEGEPNNVGASGVVGATSSLLDGIEGAFEETPVDALLTPIFDIVGSSPRNEVSVLSLVEGVGDVLAEDESSLEFLTAQTLAPIIGSRGQPAQGGIEDGAPFFETGPLF